MTRCIASLDRATDHTIHLMKQGKRRSEALQHAQRRFGVTRGAIIRELDARRHAHSGTLEVAHDDPGAHVPITLEQAFSILLARSL